MLGLEYCSFQKYPVFGLENNLEAFIKFPKNQI